MTGPLETIVTGDVQKAFDHFSAILGIKIIFHSTVGGQLRVGLNRANSSFCTLIQGQLYGRERCLSIDERKRRECLLRKGILHYRCHAGIEEAIAPVYVGYQLAGFAMIGQFRIENSLPCEVEEEWAKDHDLSELHKAFHELPYFGPEKVPHLLGLFAILINYLVSRETIALKGNATVWRILSYIEENVSRRIPLREVARLVNRSDSTVSHLFTKTMGKTFKRTVIDAKLNRAEDLLIRMPNMTIREVAEEVGFSDQFYFSRLYKKHRDISPSSFRNHHKENPNYGSPLAEKSMNSRKSPWNYLSY